MSICISTVHFSTAYVSLSLQMGMYFWTSAGLECTEVTHRVCVAVSDIQHPIHQTARVIEVFIFGLYETERIFCPKRG